MEKIEWGPNWEEILGTEFSKRSKDKNFDHIQKEEFDEAHGLLTGELYSGAGDPAEVKEKIRVAEQGILKKPAYSVSDVFARRKAIFDEKVSIRGLYREGGVIGEQSHYFWVAGSRKIKCRYHKLRVQERDRIRSVAEGAPVLVRGILRRGGSDGVPAYLEVTFFWSGEKGRKQAAAAQLKD